MFSLTQYWALPGTKRPETSVISFWIRITPDPIGSRPESQTSNTFRYAFARVVIHKNRFALTCCYKLRGQYQLLTILTLLMVFAVQRLGRMEGAWFLEKGRLLQFVHATKTGSVVKKWRKHQLLISFSTIFDDFVKYNGTRLYCQQEKIIKSVALPRLWKFDTVKPFVGHLTIFLIP